VIFSTASLCLVLIGNPWMSRYSMTPYSRSRRPARRRRRAPRRAPGPPGRPELHHPIRGRTKGVEPFRRFVTDTYRWLAEREATVEDVDVIVTDRRTVEEVVLHLDHGDNDARFQLPVAIATDRGDDGRRSSCDLIQHGGAA
jgi:hypothetical protein